MPEKYLKIGEAAEYVSLSTQTLRGYDKKRILVPALKRKSGHRLYSQKQLDEFIEKRMQA